MSQSLRGHQFAKNWPDRAAAPWDTGNTGLSPEDLPNPLREYFDAHVSGRGVWKWVHYFEAYHRHLSKFVGREVHVVEIGVCSGGSLDMWKHYFGPQCRVYGVDIEPACKKYEDDRTKIFIGDQADRGFWKNFREMVPKVDVLIDDGGHLPEQQIIPIEEMLPHLRPDGVYVCEDVHGARTGFSAYLLGLCDNLNAHCPKGGEPSNFQKEIHSLHVYPFMAVIEKCPRLREPFSAPQRGTDWEPFTGRNRGWIPQH